MADTPAAPPRAERALGGLARVMRGVAIFKFVVVAGFLWVGPIWTIVAWLSGATVLLSLLGLFMDRVSLAEVLGVFVSDRWAHVGKQLSTAYHLGSLAVGLTLMFWPHDPAWTQLVDEGNDPIVVHDGRALYLSTASTLRRFDGSEWRDVSRPPGFAWEMGADGEELWLAPREGTQYFIRRHGEWRPERRPPGMVQNADRAQGHQVLVAGGWVFDSDLPDVEVRAYDVAITNGRVLATGARWWTSAGADYRDVTPPGVTGRNWKVDADAGRFYVYRGSSFGSGQLYVGDGVAFEERTMPVSDVRAIVVHPGEPDHAFAGSWGNDVHATTDGGRTWTGLGLSGVEVRSIAVDWQGRRLYVASSNTVMDQGVWTRTF